MSDWYQPEREPRGLLSFLGGGPDLGAEVADRAGVISQILMNLGSGRGGQGIAEAMAGASERSQARRDRRQLTNMANRMADKIEPSNPGLAEVLRTNPAYGMQLLGKKYEQEWQDTSAMDRLKKQYELAGANELAQEREKARLKQQQTELVLQRAGLLDSISAAPITPDVTGAGTEAPIPIIPNNPETTSLGTGEGEVQITPLSETSTVPAPGVGGGAEPPVPVVPDNIPREYLVGLPPGELGKTVLRQRLKHQDPEISVSDVNAYTMSLLDPDMAGSQKYFDNIAKRKAVQQRVREFATGANEMARQNQALPGINLQTPGQPELMQAGIDPTTIPPNQQRQTAEYLKQAVKTGPEEYTSALKSLIPSDSAGLTITTQNADGSTTTVTTGKGGTTGGKPTEANLKHTAFYMRGKASIPELLDDKNVAALTDFTLAKAAKMPMIGNYLVKGPYQVADSAAENFLISILRPDTGATIVPEEKETYRVMFIPQPGDDANRIKYKAYLRGVALEGVRQGQTPEQIAATAKDAWRQLDPEAPGAQPPPMPQWAIDAGVSQEAWAAHPETWFVEEDEESKP